MSDPNIHRQLVYTHEGREATLSVLRDPGSGVLDLNINGQSTAFTTYMDLQVHRMLGHLPALCHPAPKNALVVGFGFGCSCHALAAEGLDVDCVELIPDERESAAWFEEVNGGVLHHPGFHFMNGDGREYLLATPRRYDIISFNAIHPKLARASTPSTSTACAPRASRPAAWSPHGCR